jgi:hypothetical protein
MLRDLNLPEFEGAYVHTHSFVEDKKRFLLKFALVLDVCGKCPLINEKPAMQRQVKIFGDALKKKFFAVKGQPEQMNLWLVAQREQVRKAFLEQCKEVLKRYVVFAIGTLPSDVSFRIILVGSKTKRYR